MATTWAEITITLMTLGASLTLTAVTAGGGERPGSRITILVYNYAGMSADTLTRAEDEMTRIFHHAGVDATWRDCLLDFRSKNDPCPVPSPSTPALRFQSQFQLVPDAVHLNTVGFSVGYFATVSVEFAEELARAGMAALHEVLAHIAAHELGHILLPGNAHTVSGIMKAAFSLDDWAIARQGRLFFAPQQAAFMRKELFVRWEQ